MADFQERQLTISESILKKLDEVIQRQKKLEDDNARLRKENENLKTSSPREKAPKRRRSGKVLIPEDLPVSGDSPRDYYVWYQNRTLGHDL